MSQADIEAGERWAVEVAKELEAANFGIICVTQENVASPWVLFESGALAKSIQIGRAIPLLLDMDFKDISGPLAQFQAKKAEREGIYEIVLSINTLSEQRNDETRVRQLLDLAWPKLEEKISGLSKARISTKPHRPTQEILEELVASIRAMEGRFRRSESTESLPRANPKLMRHLLEAASGSGVRAKPFLLALVSSIFRDSAPWLFALGMEHAKAMSSGSKTRYHETRKHLLDAIDFTVHGPAMDIAIRDETSHLALRYFQDMLKGDFWEDLSADVRR